MAGATHGGLTLARTDLGGGVYTAFLRTRDFGTVISWSLARADAWLGLLAQS
jgi:hypothetical protein